MVLLPGIVRGMGQEAEVEVLSRRMQDHNASGALLVFRYVDLALIGGPAELPDGDYIVYFAGFSAVVTRRNGKWLSPGIAIPDEAHAPGADEEAEAVQASPRGRDPITEEPKAEPPAVKTSPQRNGPRSFRV